MPGEHCSWCALQGRVTALLPFYLCDSCLDKYKKMVADFDVPISLIGPCKKEKIINAM